MFACQLDVCVSMCVGVCTEMHVYLHMHMYIYVCMLGTEVNIACCSSGVSHFIYLLSYLFSYGLSLVWNLPSRLGLVSPRASPILTFPVLELQMY